MPIVMKRIFNIRGDYTDEQKEVLIRLIDMFRTTISDHDAEKNILNNKSLMYTDDRVLKLLLRAVADINGGVPLTNFDIFYIAREVDDTLIVDGAVVFALISEGLLQTRNQLPYSDSGLQINMFDKTQLYQSWIGMLMNNYMSAKADFKQTILTKHSEDTFVGISSEFARYWY